MRQTHQPRQSTDRRYPTTFQDAVNHTESILLNARNFFGHLKLPVAVTDGKLTRMTVFPKGQDPLRLLMERSPAHLERDISRTISSLTVELRAFRGDNDFGGSLANEVTFGDGSYTGDRVLDRYIERNFPSVATVNIREPEGWHTRGTFHATIHNLSLNDGVWRRFMRALNSSSSVEVLDHAHDSDTIVSLKTDGDGAFAVLSTCQEALISAHQPRIPYFRPRGQRFSIEEWQLAPAVDRFYEAHCREAFRLLADEWELRKATLPQPPKESFTALSRRSGGGIGYF